MYLVKLQNNIMTSNNQAFDISKINDTTTLVNKHVSVIQAPLNNITYGKIMKVLDGDGLICCINNKNLNIRLAYIDAPEYNQEHGKESKKWLESQYLNKNVYIKSLDYDEKHERYIAEIFLDTYLDDVFIKNCSLSWLMAATGNAWAYYDFLTKDMEEAYLDAQYFARKIRRTGLWVNNLHPTPPWFFRAQEKGENIRLFLEPSLGTRAVLMSIIAAGNLNDKNIQADLAEANRLMQYNRDYCPMRYYNQICLDKMQYETIICNSLCNDWDIKTGYNGVEGTEFNTEFFQIADRAFQGDEEAVYEYEAWKRGLHMAVGKTSMPGHPAKRLTKEWVDAQILRVEKWLRENNL